jgi:hypothetical protein
MHECLHERMYMHSSLSCTVHSKTQACIHGFTCFTSYSSTVNICALEASANPCNTATHFKNVLAKATAAVHSKTHI